MKKIVISILVFVLFSQLTYAQKHFKNYVKDWEKVYKFELESLPKSALIEVEKISIKAHADKNTPQIVKTLIYKSKFALTLEEDAQLKIIEDLKNEIDQSVLPAKNILESILADLYWQYFQQNRWKFYNRTKVETLKGSGQTDFRTWDLQTIFEEINTHYQNSLLNSLLLQQTDLKQFNDILILQVGSKNYRPTLYDFIAQRAINFYKNDERNLTRPSYKFEIDNPDLLGTNKQFISADIYSKDSLSQQLQALKLYKKLTLFHLRDSDPTALIDLTLERLRFVKINAVFENKDSIYLSTLQHLSKNNKNHKVSTEIDYQIANLFTKLANQYQPKKNEEYRFKYKEALEICEHAIAIFPKSIGTQKCEVLKSKILQKNISITSEKYISINTNSRLLIDYKNTDKLSFTAFKITKKQQEKFNKIYTDSARIAFIQKLDATKKWTAILHNEHDYQQHKTEVLLPPLAHGNYLIFATTDSETLNTNKTIAYSFVQATNLTLIENNQNGNYTYQIVDRNTGKPIESARVNLKNYNTGRYNLPINRNFTTDINGQFTFRNKIRHNNVVSTVTHEDETATFGDYYLSKHYKNDNNGEDEYIEIKPFIFTDRSIYRPGQTVYFKAIILKKQGGKTKIFTDEYVEVLLEDPNGEEIKLLNLKLNEFGSVSGEFKLPSGGLTGEYTIIIDESYEYDSKFYDDDDADYEFSYDSDYIFSVEEYKRPKFETKFNPVTETYKLNDSITVNGTAIAFSGSNITDAKVQYRVVRTANFPRWYNWYSSNSYQSESLEIIHGEGLTDAEGNYEITFKAIPDLKVLKESQPTFSYQIYVDITDINGETRSAETTVKVGYHALTAKVSVDSNIDKTKEDNKLTISTNNLNNEYVPTKGTIRIYKLQAPQNPMRIRPWNAPDYQEFTETEFRNLFPHDAYTDDENDEKNWKKGILVLEKYFDTEISKELVLGNIKKWISGKYIVVLVCKDKFNQEVKDEQRFTIFDTKDKTVVDNKLFFINTNKSIYKPNEEVKLQVGSASKDLTVTVNIEKNHKITKTYFIHLNNETKTITIPVKATNIGGFAIKYHFVNYNSFKNGILHIAVPYTSDNLQFETLTFRDKLQPGSKQTWSFKIKGDKNDKIVSELLASMYDASLDEFKNHHWSFNPIQRYQYSPYQNSNANQSFGTNRFTIRNQYRSYSNYPQQHYDALNWYGFSINNNRWANDQYLARVKKERTKYDKIVNGTITDESGPLPGVNVIIKGTSFGTTTDFDGHYSIKVKSNDELIFSFIGMVTASEKVGKSSEINMILNADENSLDEVVVTAFGIKRKNKSLGYASIMATPETAAEDGDIGQILAGKVSGVSIVDSATSVKIRGSSSIAGMNNPLYIVDGIPVKNFDINGNDVTDISILKGEAAISLYGAQGANGVIIIATKSGQAKIDAELSKVQARKNLQETAFFFPYLRTDKNSNVSFNFTVPEALTRWKLQLLAHNKELKIGYKQLNVITQKELMVVPNVPRFLRQNDQITINTKITNLSDKNLNGTAQIVLTDAITQKDITKELLKDTSNKINFSIKTNGNTNVNWILFIPENAQAIQYKIVALAGNFSDGEQNILPVLSNRMLVTETLSMQIKSNQTKTFTLDKLKENTSSTLKNHKLTLEVTSNPVWYAIQAIPYLMEYPYECSEQTFSRYYANSLATFLVGSNPKIEKIFKQWSSSETLVSNLEKNQELKSIIIQETPWLRDAQNETEQKKRLALLFDLTKMKSEQEKAFQKLKQMQMTNGGFPWFTGNQYPNRNITQHIAIGFGHLNKLTGNSFDNLTKEQKMFLTKIVRFLDDEILEDYKKVLKNAKKFSYDKITDSYNPKKEKEYLDNNHTSSFQLQYLYMRSFYKNLPIKNELLKGFNYYKNQSYTFWLDYKLNDKGLISLIANRNENQKLARSIIQSLAENSITNEELGMYWKENKPSWYWFQSPIETQALMLEAFHEVGSSIESLDNLKLWLLKNKQTNRWETTKATTNAIYAILNYGSNWLNETEMVEVKVGNKKIDPNHLENSKIEAGTGYFKTTWHKTEIKPDMADITLQKSSDGIAFGALYWQYFEDLDKITAAESPLQINKKLYLKRNTDHGKELTEITNSTKLKLGDLVTVRIEIKVDREMEFIHLKDMRASGFEPVNTLSQYKYQDGLSYYESTKDASTNFFFDVLPKGVYIFEYDLRVNNQGIFSNGITTIQSMYAPEFGSHSKGVRVNIE
ncbi:MAG: MG2 domain-containing protein [Bacteroidota bacterium]